MLLQNIRAKIGARLNGDSEGGFTLIELLVVMLILGILAAIALPAFFNQKSKAGDAKAKENLHTAQVAMETCATDNNGTYSATNCTATQLNKIEPTIPATLPTEAAAAPGAIITITPSGTGYTLEAKSAVPGGKFSITNAAGTLTFGCTKPNEGGCPSTSNWGS